jgi:GTP-binding protein TypA/BipA
VLSDGKFAKYPSAMTIDEVLTVYGEKQDDLLALNQEKISIDKELKLLEPWGDFSWNSIQRLQENGWYIRFYSCLERDYKQAWEDEYTIIHISQSNGSINFLIVSKDAVSLDVDPVSLPKKSLSELEKNLAMRIEETDSPDSLIVFGRGILHLSILIETMRREGYELQVGQPKVIVKEIDGKKCEPVEQLTILVPEEFSSKVIDIVTRRKGDVNSIDTKGDRVQLEFTIPSRGIIGLRNNLLTVSNGEAIIAHRFKAFEPWKGEMGTYKMGALIAKETGTSTAYSISKLQDRGQFFIEPGEDVYAGQVVGENAKDNDIVVNVTKSKKLTNMRASGSDDKVKLIPPVVFSLEEALEYIKEDEYVEVTPHHIRLRKIILDEIERKRANKV